MRESIINLFELFCEEMHSESFDFLVQVITRPEEEYIAELEEERTGEGDGESGDDEEDDEEDEEDGESPAV